MKVPLTVCSPFYFVLSIAPFTRQTPNEIYGTDIDVMMISCDGCDVWQHGACVGIWGDEEAPDGEPTSSRTVYYSALLELTRGILQNTIAMNVSRACMRRC